MSIYDKVVEYVDTAFKGKQKRHFERAVYWLEKFSPIFSEAHKIAAYSHDIERAFRDKDKNVPENYLDLDFLEHPSETGADIMSQFLIENNARANDVQKVIHLISKHEVGGDAEQNALMDADSVSFFETNAEMFVKEKAPHEGVEKVKEKLDWMFNRISTDEHKKFAKINYDKWISELVKSEKK
ncbi:MAG: DUF4202 family protein [Patescibacteria group bacterium]